MCRLCKRPFREKSNSASLALATCGEICWRSNTEAVTTGRKMLWTSCSGSLDKSINSAALASRAHLAHRDNPAKMVTMVPQETTAPQARRAVMPIQKTNFCLYQTSVRVKLHPDPADHQGQKETTDLRETLERAEPTVYQADKENRADQDSQDPQASQDRRDHQENQEFCDQAHDHPQADQDSQADQDHQGPQETQVLQAKMAPQVASETRDLQARGASQDDQEMQVPQVPQVSQAIQGLATTVHQPDWLLDIKQNGPDKLRLDHFRNFQLLPMWLEKAIVISWSGYTFP